MYKLVTSYELFAFGADTIICLILCTTVRAEFLNWFSMGVGLSLSRFANFTIMLINHLISHRQRPVVELRLLDEAPELGEEDGPEEEHGDDGRDGLLAPDADAGFEADAVALGEEGDFKGGFHADHGFEEAAFADGDVTAACAKGVFADLESVFLEIFLNMFGYLRDKGWRTVNDCFSAECGHGLYVDVLD